MLTSTLRIKYYDSVLEVHVHLCSTHFKIVRALIKVFCVWHSCGMWNSVASVINLTNSAAETVIFMLLQQLNEHGTVCLATNI
jgi:hypothetical protein